MLGSLTLKEPEYGSGSRAIPINSISDIKYIRITDFSDDGIPPNHEFVTAETVEDKYTLEHEDILFARSGATAGKTFIYTADIGEAIFAGYCIRFQFDCMKVIPKFVYFYTKTRRYQSWVNSIQRPSGQPNINKEEFKSFTIPIPPLEVQRSFVAEIEAARQTRKQKLAQADELLFSIDTYLLEQLGLNIFNKLDAGYEDAPQCFAIRRADIDGKLDLTYNSPLTRKKLKGLESGNFQLVQLKSLISPLKGIRYGTSTPPPIIERSEDTVPFIRATDIKNGEILTKNLLHIDVVQDERMNKCLLEAGEMILVRSGVNTGDCAVVPDFLAGSYAAYDLILQFGNEVIPSFVSAFLHTEAGRTQLNLLKARSAQPHLNAEEVSSIKIPKPPISFQQLVVVEIEKRRAEAQRLRQEAETEWEAAKTCFERKLLGQEA
jgi:type I restriction enzyme, S subunit